MTMGGLLFLFRRIGGPRNNRHAPSLHRRGAQAQRQETGGGYSLTARTPPSAVA